MVAWYSEAGGTPMLRLARRFPDLGLALLRDFTVVVPRVALVPRAAAAPELGMDEYAAAMSLALEAAPAAASSSAGSRPARRKH